VSAPAEGLRWCLCGDAGRGCPVPSAALGEQGAGWQGIVVGLTAMEGAGTANSKRRRLRTEPWLPRRAAPLPAAAVWSVRLPSAGGPVLFCCERSVSAMKLEKWVLRRPLKHKRRLMILQITRLTHTKVY